LCPTPNAIAAASLNANGLSKRQRESEEGDKRSKLLALAKVTGRTRKGVDRCDGEGTTQRLNPNPFTPIPLPT
jgi:hypothetical protein